MKASICNSKLPTDEENCGTCGSQYGKRLMKFGLVMLLTTLLMGSVFILVLYFLNQV